MKKILVPFDFSSAAQEAYKFALNIAAASSGEVMVLKVTELPVIYGNGMPGQPYAYVDPVSYLDQSTKESGRKFEEMKHSFGKPKVPVFFSVEPGDVADTILRMIKEKEIDLVVMGTSGTTGINEFFVGSNTEKIVRISPVPVFAVHKAHPLFHIKKILFPTNFDLNQSELIGKIKALQSFFKAKLYPLYVLTPSSHFSEKEAMTNLENYAKFYSLQDYELNIQIQDDERKGILTFASGLKHAIIAMATHGHKGITHLLMGSVAEDVVNHAQEEVWTYVSGHDSDRV